MAQAGGWSRTGSKAGRSRARQRFPRWTVDQYWLVRQFCGGREGERATMGRVAKRQILNLNKIRIFDKIVTVTISGGGTSPLPHVTMYG